MNLSNRRRIFNRLRKIVFLIDSFNFIDLVNSKLVFQIDSILLALANNFPAAKVAANVFCGPRTMSAITKMMHNSLKLIKGIITYSLHQLFQLI